MRGAADTESPLNLLSVSLSLSQWTTALTAKRQAGRRAGGRVMQQLDLTVSLPKVNEALQWTAEQQDFLLASWVFATQPSVLQIESLALMLPAYWNYLPLSLLLPDTLSFSHPYMHSPHAVFVFTLPWRFCKAPSVIHPHICLKPSYMRDVCERTYFVCIIFSLLFSFDFIIHFATSHECSLLHGGVIGL